MALLGVAPSWKLDSIFIEPEHLGFIKIDAVLLLVGVALDWMMLLQTPCGMENIPKNSTSARDECLLTTAVTYPCLLSALFLPAKRI